MKNTKGQPHSEIAQSNIRPPVNCFGFGIYRDFQDWISSIVQTSVHTPM